MPSNSSGTDGHVDNIGCCDGLSGVSDVKGFCGEVGVTVVVVVVAGAALEPAKRFRNVDSAMMGGR